jgi:hypothetical protein
LKYQLSELEVELEAFLPSLERVKETVKQLKRAYQSNLEEVVQSQSSPISRIVILRYVLQSSSGRERKERGKAKVFWWGD